MKKRYALIVCMTVCGAALFAQTADDFSIGSMGAGNGVIIHDYHGPGGKVVIPGTIGRERVITIAESAFYGCETLTSVTIPESVTYIDETAFRACDNLTAISVSAANRKYKDVDGVLFTKDGETLIAYPGGGRSVYTIPEGVTSIGRWAFSGSALTSVTIPEGVDYIGDSAFSSCDNLAAISVSAANREYKDIGGVLFTKDGKTLLGYPGGGKSVYTIPEGVTSIGRRAFSPCAGLTSVTIPEGVTSIGETAFYWCKSLTSVAIPKSVTAVGNSAFASCDSLKPEIKSDIQKRFGDSVL